MEPDLDRVWRELRALVARLAASPDRRVFLDEALDLLVELSQASRGLILLLDQAGEPFAINARAPGRSLGASERAEISRTLVRLALEAGRAIVWEPDIDGSAASAVRLGVTAALLAPLRTATGEDRGVIYLDFRDRRGPIGARHCDFLDTAAQLVSMVLAQEGWMRGSSLPPTLAELLRPPSMQVARAEITSCLASELPILITGESGTGKTLLAQAIAEGDTRRPIVRGTLGHSDDLNTITSELFGHERGSFSGAVGKRVGLVEFADGGTLILDEILNLPPHAQQLLLDFTQFGTYRPLGWSAAEPKRARVRLISVTNGDLAAAIARKAFREDLYYRIASVPVVVPPLRKRRDEIPALAETFLRRVDPARSWTLTSEARAFLLSETNDWPGNVRQLEATVQRARLRALAVDPAATTLGRETFDAGPAASPVVAPPSDDDEGARILAALERCGGNQTRAAELLGMPRRTFVRRLAELDVPRPRKR